MEVINATRTGWPSAVNRDLDDRLTQLTKNCDFKIGITNSPYRRADEYNRREKFDKMTLLYWTSSSKNAKELEIEMISSFRNKFDIRDRLRFNQGRCQNIRSGGGKIIPESSYYLYVVTRKLCVRESAKRMISRR